MSLEGLDLNLEERVQVSVKAVLLWLIVGSWLWVFLPRDLVILADLVEGCECALTLCWKVAVISWGSLVSWWQQPRKSAILCII